MTTYFIYSITNTVNGFVYIGITIDYDSRIRGHKWQLINNRHKCKLMQSDFNKYGLDNFDFKFLRRVKFQSDQEAKIEESIEIVKHEKSYNSLIITKQVKPVKAKTTDIKLCTTNSNDFFIYWRDFEGRLVKKRCGLNKIKDLKERKKAGLSLVKEYQNNFTNNKKTGSYKVVFVST